ncbi:MAG: hypothetical protein M0C28_18620 [Candidatus Moduliflexus flocculans]|nr:hypothetical protein [Candidatus Moduliflexus flocculans]
MKNIIAATGLTAAIVSLFALVFVFGGMYSRFMTAQIEARADEGANAEWLAMFLARRASGNSTSPTSSKKPMPSRTAAATLRRRSSPPTNSMQADVNTAVGVIYVVESYGKFAGVQVAFAFDLATDTVVAVKVIAQSETLSLRNARNRLLRSIRRPRAR